jgi:hypothetical protein
MLEDSIAFHSKKNSEPNGMALEAFPSNGSAYRIVLDAKREGVYVFVFLTNQSASPEIDLLQDDFEMAKIACEDDFGVSPDAWIAVPGSNESAWNR